MYFRITAVHSQVILRFVAVSMFLTGCSSMPCSSGTSSSSSELPVSIGTACWAEIHYRRSLLGRSGELSVEAVILPDTDADSLLIVMVPTRRRLPSFSTYEGRMFIDEELIEAQSAVHSILEMSGVDPRIRISWCTPPQHRSERHRSLLGASADHSAGGNDQGDVDPFVAPSPQSVIWLTNAPSALAPSN